MAASRERTPFKGGADAEAARKRQNRGAVFSTGSLYLVGQWAGVEAGEKSIGWKSPE